MSLWQFEAVTDGYIEAHVPEDARQGLSDNEADELWDWMVSKA